MSVNQFKKVKLGLVLVLAAIMGGSLMLDNTQMRQSSLVAFLGMGLYLALVSLLKTRVDGVLIDERQSGVAGKAAQVSFQILMPLLLLTSVALMMSGGENEFYYVRALGILLSYVACLGLVIYLLAYIYFDRITGGGESD